VATTADLSVAIVRGDAARALLLDSHFVQLWQKLYEQCPWATGFQSPSFVLAWYRSYDFYEPLLILGRDRHQNLVGFFTLARSEGELVVAGARQAEYHTWITLPDVGSAFMLAAYPQIQSVLGRTPLVLQYLPPGVPLDWIDRGARHIPCRLEGVPRPLMRLVTGDMEDPFKKKNNKSKLNRLAKLGEVRFERVTTRSDLENVLEQITLFYDLRQAAIGAGTPFRSDPRKREFHLALAEAPALLHVTVLRAGDRLVGAHLGVASGSVVHLGILTHSPFLAQHSPGKLHLMFLAHSMTQSGYTTFDLTPGADPWKERFANDRDTVNRLTVYRTFAGLKRAEYEEVLAGVARSMVRAVGLQPTRVREVVDATRRKGLLNALAHAAGAARRHAFEKTELRAYRMSLPGMIAGTLGDRAERDTISSLLKFEEAAGTPTVERFFQAAVTRLEDGCHVYCRVEDGRLIHWGWFAPQQERSFLDEVHQDLIFPEGSGTLFDFYTHPDYRRRGYYERSLREMIEDAMSAGVKQLYIFVRADNVASRRAIEKVGFAYEFSLFEQKRWTKVTRWRVPDKSGAPAPSDA